MPGFQYAWGRQCTSWSSIQCQAPAAGGSVNTDSARWAAARSGMCSSKWTTMTCPTPYVSRPASESPLLACRYGIVTFAGWTVVNVLVWLTFCPSAPVPDAESV